MQLEPMLCLPRVLSHIVSRMEVYRIGYEMFACTETPVPNAISTKIPESGPLIARDLQNDRHPSSTLVIFNPQETPLPEAHRRSSIIQRLHRTQSCHQAQLIHTRRRVPSILSKPTSTKDLDIQGGSLRPSIPQQLCAFDIDWME